MDQTIYAFWNGQDIYNILNAVVLVTGGAQAGAYAHLMASVALVAFLVAIGVGLAKLRATDTALAFMSLTFFYGIFFVPTVTVYIDDVRLTQNYQVDNVPLGLALFGGVTSHIGYWLTDTYETNFTSVDDEKFSKYGFLMGTRIINELPKQYYKSPVVRENVKNFMLNCVNPELDANPSTVGYMANVNDMWKFISGQLPYGIKLNPGRVTPYWNQWNQTESVMPCIGPGGLYDYTGAVAFLNIDTLIGAFPELNLLTNKLAPGVMGSSFQWTTVSDFETAMLGISRGPIETIRHYALINMARDTNADRAGVFAATLSTAETESAYNNMATWAEGALPKVRNVIEEVVYAVFPIVFLIVIAAGPSGGKVLGMYAMTAVWLQLWAPLYAVINSIMYAASQTELLNLVFSSGGTMTNIPNMLSMTASTKAIAGLMTLSVPAIALAIVKGGAATASGIADSLMSPGGAIASRVGAETAAGNIELGHVSYGQVNTAPNTTRGAASETVIGQDGSRQTSHADGSSTLDRRPTQSNLGAVSASAAVGARHQASEASAERATASAEAAGVRSHSLAAAYEAAKAYEHHSGGSNRVSSGSGIRTLDQFTRAYENSQATAAKWDAGVHLSDSEKQMILTEAAGSIGFGGGAKGIGFSAGLSTRLAKTGMSEAQMQGLWNSARSYAESSGFKDQVNAAQHFATTLDTASTSESGHKALSEVKSHLTDADRAESTQRSSLAQAQSYEKIASMIDYSDGQAKADLSNYIVGKLGGADQANATLSSMDTGQQLALVNDLTKQWVQEQGARMQKGNPQQNAGLQGEAAVGTPQPGNPAGFYGNGVPEVSATHTRNSSRVPGSANAAPSVNVGGQTVRPQTVEKAVAAGKDAGESGLDTGQTQADDGRQTVVAPVQNEQANPSLRTRAGKIFIGHDPNEGNPASRERNTGAADGQWEEGPSKPPTNTGGADGKW